MNNSNPTEAELEKKLSELLTELENAVERSTVARINGRTYSNRMIHGGYLAKMLDAVSQAKEAWTREARIDELKLHAGDFKPSSKFYCVILDNDQLKKRLAELLPPNQERIN